MSIFQFICNVSLPCKKWALIEEAILRMADSLSLSYTLSVLTELKWEIALMPDEHIIFILHKLFSFAFLLFVKKIAAGVRVPV